VDVQKTVVFVDEAAAPVAGGATDPWLRKAHRRNRGFIASMAAVAIALAGLVAWFLVVA
jgi:hypothetical protein